MECVLVWSSLCWPCFWLSVLPGPGGLFPFSGFWKITLMRPSLIFLLIHCTSWLLAFFSSFWQIFLSFLLFKATSEVDVIWNNYLFGRVWFLQPSSYLCNSEHQGLIWSKNVKAFFPGLVFPLPKQVIQNIVGFWSVCLQAFQIYM